MSALDAYRLAHDKRAKTLEWMALVGKAQHFPNERGSVFAAKVTLHHQEYAGATNYHEAEYGFRSPFVLALQECWPAIMAAAKRRMDEDVSFLEAAARVEYERLFGAAMPASRDARGTPCLTCGGTGEDRRVHGEWLSCDDCDGTGSTSRDAAQAKEAQ